MKRKYARPFIQKCSPGGALGDLGTHLIDMCRFMGLEFVQVCGMNEVYGKQRKSGEEMITTTANELCLFNARFQNDALGLFELSRVSGGAGGMIFEIHGTKGSVRWEKNSINSLKVYIPDKICDGWGYKRIDANEIILIDAGTAASEHAFVVQRKTLLKKNASKRWDHPFCRVFF